ncbi:uncharacterized protein C8R40DRAFT_1106731, partial [Lentinula edodes]|uniref:uncharacterized protein n=1 Tax=Lentinula edodes TaxID=5353 RepID=UPI001E8E62F7
MKLEKLWDLSLAFTVHYAGNECFYIPKDLILHIDQHKLNYAIFICMQDIELIL